MSTRRQLERIHDVAQERPSVVEQIDAAVVEGVGQPLAGPIDREHAMALRERREDRHDLVCAAQPSVDVQKRRPAAEFKQLRLALRPADAPHLSVRRVAGEQRRLCPLEFQIQLWLHRFLLVPIGRSGLAMMYGLWPGGQGHEGPSDESRGSWELLLEVELRRGRLRRSLTEALRTAIQGGRLPASTVPPSSRRLAGGIGVSRGVVTDAYDQLVSEGYLDVKPRFPPVVAAVAAGQPPAAEPPAPRWRFDFNATTPDVGLFPRRAWVRAVERALRAAPDAALEYGRRPRTDRAPHRPECLPGASARRAGASGSNRRHAGVQPGTRSALPSPVRTGRDPVAMETPSHPELWETVRMSGLRLVGCPVDSDGLRTDELAALDADAAVVAPAHQFPTGEVMGPARRLAVVDWAVAREALVIEDDYDAEFRYDRAPVGAVQGLDPERVAHVGTASKTLAPGVRLGWMSLPLDLVEEVAMRSSSPTEDRRPSISLRSRTSCPQASTSGTWFAPAMNIGTVAIGSFELCRRGFLGSSSGELRRACSCSSNSLTRLTTWRSQTLRRREGYTFGRSRPCTSPRAANGVCCSATVVWRRAGSTSRSARCPRSSRRPEQLADHAVHARAPQSPHRGPGPTTRWLGVGSLRLLDYARARAREGKWWARPSRTPASRPRPDNALAGGGVVAPALLRARACARGEVVGAPEQDRNKAPTALTASEGGAGWYRLRKTAGMHGRRSLGTVDEQMLRACVSDRCHSA